MGPIEDAIRRVLASAEVSREDWAAFWAPHEPMPMSDDQLAILGLHALLRRQRALIPELAADAVTRADLAAAIEASRARRPGKLEAEVYGPVAAPLERLLGDLAALMATERIAIERLAVEQIPGDDGVVDAALAAAPIPEPSAADLAAVRAAADAHSEALALVGRGLDQMRSSG